METKTESPIVTLSENIKTRKVKIGVIGLGYVGLPLALEIVNKGFQVIGFDKNDEKINFLKSGRSYIADLPETIMQEAISKEKFEATDNFTKLAEVNVIIICVPTPTAEDGTPNISYIVDAAHAIEQNMSADTLIILESTTYPGTTEDVVRPILEKQDFVIGQDIFLAYSPERVDPGNQNFTVTNTPKVVGGISKSCADIARIFYETVINTNVYAVTSPKVAEMEKLLENTFRQINIALVNEMSQLCYKMDIDIWEVIDAASTKPYGFMPFTPGPGVGGHCIPVDPKYLLWAGQQHGITATLIETADKINESMPNFVVERLAHYLNTQNKRLHDAEIVIIGVTYKPNVNDFRESPALNVINILRKNHCNIKIVDPFLETVIADGSTMNTVPLTEEIIRSADAVLILTNHTNINYALIDEHAALIFDTRNTHFLFKNQNYYKL
ncbi:nucleotide sugar dehydrogenase [Lysinibacillus parviboronicapiens]|uniref:nucleotide sugar dehydrogenase n=1 Tax=Lysinibacillus parviboronicapiens TaxID=436516 RepID=UPI000D3C5166|nr:nucleotide sugar dehydrogenase [Lysinibacillus parviboronicapiens]